MSTLNIGKPWILIEIHNESVEARLQTNHFQQAINSHLKQNIPNYIFLINKMSLSNRRTLNIKWYIYYNDDYCIMKLKNQNQTHQCIQWPHYHIPFNDLCLPCLHWLLGFSKYCEGMGEYPHQWEGWEVLLEGIFLSAGGHLRSDFDHSNLFQNWKQHSVNTEHWRGGRWAGGD